VLSGIERFKIACIHYPFARRVSVPAARRPDEGYETVSNREELTMRAMILDEPRKPLRLATVPDLRAGRLTGAAVLVVDAQARR
jgi:hypothetical protein